MTTLEEELQKDPIDMDFIMNTLRPTTIRDTHFYGPMCRDLARLEIDHIINFFDLFDINEFEEGTTGCERYTVFCIILNIINRIPYIHLDKIIYMLNKGVNLDIKITLSNKEKQSIYGHINSNYSSKNKIYVDKINEYHNIVTNLQQLLNNKKIIPINIFNKLETIKYLLIISKMKNKILPKCLILYKILYFYLL
jgi:hypothetical protein